MKKRFSIFLVVIMIIAVLAGCGQSDNQQGTQTTNTTREIVDMRGVTVTIPKSIERVAIIDKGFVLQCMVAMDVSDKIVASGDLIQTATKPTDRDSLFLCPKLLDLPQIGYPTAVVDFETLLGSKPDIVILRNSEYIKDSEITADAIKKIEEDLKIPLIVVNGPGCYDEVKLETQYEGIKLLGQVFGKEERAQEIIDLMSGTITMIKERTKDIADSDKPSVMYIGGINNEDAAGSVWGVNYGDAKFSVEVANIKNVYTEHGRAKMSSEQIVALDPDVMILCTVSPEPDVILNKSSFASWRNIKAIQNKRIASLGLLTWWGDFRLEAPTIMMIAAKSVYPELFEDIDVGAWLNEYHKELYNLADEQAQQLKDVQDLEWMDKAGF